MEIFYSRSIKAGRRIYYLDVKRSLNGELFLSITESKKLQPNGGTVTQYEKHKVFLYQEDFSRFIEGLVDTISYIKQHRRVEKK